MKMILGGLRQPNVHSDIAGWSPSSYAFVFNKRANCGVIAFRFFKCEKCSNRGIKKTIALQHGLYVDYEGHETVNTSNYLHHVSQNFLAWGNNTKRLIQKYKPTSNVYVCGKPVATI